MNLEESKKIIFKMKATWPSFLMTTAQANEWMDTLKPLPYDAGVKAIEELRVATDRPDRMPSHTELVAATQDAARRLAISHPERSLPEAESDDDGTCHRCGGTGWAEVEVRGGQFAVERCKCTTGKRTNRALDEGYEHSRGCSCYVCTYGHARARGMRKPREGDPLAKVIPAEARPVTNPYSDPLGDF